MSPEEITTLAHEIAAALGEKEEKPLLSITRLIELCGVDFAREMLALTLEIEAQGGILVVNGVRRRTPGGVFFYLVKDAVSDELRPQIFPYLAEQKQKTASESSPRAPAPPPAPPLPAFEWEAREALVQGLRTEAGTASAGKIVLMGRPQRVQKREGFVQLALTHGAAAPTLPRGVPRVTLHDSYTVYILAKQWQRPAEALDADPSDFLIIEGACALDAAKAVVQVYASSVTTRELQRQRFARQNARNDSG